MPVAPASSQQNTANSRHTASRRPDANDTIPSEPSVRLARSGA
jgi:hypothetical protein